MAAHARLNYEFTENEKCHNLMRWLKLYLGVLVSHHTVIEVCLSKCFFHISKLVGVKTISFSYNQNVLRHLAYLFHPTSVPLGPRSKKEIILKINGNMGMQVGKTAFLGCAAFSHLSRKTSSYRIKTAFANDEIWSVSFIMNLFNAVKVSTGMDIGNISIQNLSRYFGTALVYLTCIR